MLNCFVQHGDVLSPEDGSWLASGQISFTILDA